MTPAERCEIIIEGQDKWKQQRKEKRYYEAMFKVSEPHYGAGDPTNPITIIHAMAIPVESYLPSIMRKYQHYTLHAASWKCSYPDSLKILSVNSAHI